MSFKIYGVDFDISKLELEDPKEFFCKQIQQQLDAQYSGQVYYKELTRQTGRTTYMLLRAIQHALNGKSVKICAWPKTIEEYLIKQAHRFTSLLDLPRFSWRGSHLIEEEGYHGSITIATHFRHYDIIMMDNSIDDMINEEGYEVSVLKQKYHILNDHRYDTEIPKQKEKAFNMKDGEILQLVNSYGDTFQKGDLVKVASDHTALILGIKPSKNVLSRANVIEILIGTDVYAISANHIENLRKV